MLNNNKLVSLIPLSELEDEAISQIENCLQKPFLIKLAVMPDCHAGYDLPIGGVALLDGVISPSYVGFDIGCGVSHYHLDRRASSITKKEYEDIYREIKEKIPHGEGKERVHSADIGYTFPNASNGPKEYVDRIREKLDFQCGTLGGGNHFLELGESTETGNLCVTIHSGSRNPGHTVCTHYMKLAKEINTGLPDGFLKLNSDLGQAYLIDMVYMLEFALDNRKRMMRDVLLILNCGSIEERLNNPIDFINLNHNHAVVNHDGTVLHRKGATPAGARQLGIIPGNMRDGVAITEGLGNQEYLLSASHGAGRKMSRSKAFQNLDLEKFKEEMNGIISSTDVNILDESPSAYKDFDHVLSLQEGKVINIIDRVKPIINIKGEGSARKYKKILKRKVKNND